MAAIGVTGSTGTGVCPHHSSPLAYVTTIYTGASNVGSSGEDLAIVGSLGSSTCGHTTTALTGSSLITYEGDTGVHRVGDTGANYGTYTLVTGDTLLQDNLG